nr:DUF5045 domain-containing protein [Prevotella sp.]
MKKIILFILMMLPVAVFGQGMTFNHDSSVMNQFTVGETGVGSFTPELYYDLFHNSYSDGARMTNKQAFRTEMQLTLHKQEPMAEKLDSALTHRMRVEMMNIADRTPGVTDIAWQVERGKIEGKLAILKRNIERITINGGSVQSYREWIVRYNCIQCGIDAIRNAYLSQGSRKEQYIAIYRDILQKNVEVCAYLNYLNSEKMTKDLQSSTKAVHPIDTSQVARI